MWSTVEKELVDLLSAQLYPKVYSDAGYRVLLSRAGLATLRGVQDGRLVGNEFFNAQNGWYQGKPMTDNSGMPASGNLQPNDLRRLHAAAEVQVRLMLMDVRDLDCLVEDGAKATPLTGKGFIYRVWDAKSQNQTRHWWFSQAIKDQAIRESSQQGISPHEWIRDALAISIDYGECDRLSRIALEDLGGVPRIEAKGLSKPQRTPVHRAPSGKTIGFADDDYWLRLGKFFRGEKTQYFVPYLPPDAIKPDAWPATP